MDRGTIIRIIMFILAWVNTYLVKKGLQPIPVLDEQVIAQIILFVVSVWTLWKNNYISKKGKKQKEVIDKYGLK
jgi:SPP1 family holin